MNFIKEKSEERISNDELFHSAPEENYVVYFFKLY